MLLKSEFNKLSLADKGRIVFSDGKYLGFRSYYGFNINLYLYNDYFVEAWYFPEENKIKKIETIEDNDKKLNLYIINPENQKSKK